MINYGKYEEINLNIIKIFNKISILFSEITAVLLFIIKIMIN